MTERARKALRDLAIRQQVLLERFKSGEARGAVLALRELESASLSIINSLEDDVGRLTRRELNRVLKSLSKSGKAVFTKVSKGLTEDFSSFADFQAELEGKALQTIGPKLALVYPTAGVAYAKALAEPVSATGQFLPQLIQSWSEAEERRLNSAVQRAWGEGWTNQRLIQSIRGTRAAKFQNGILATTRRNAQSITRTAIQHVASSARSATWEANKNIVTGYLWVSTLDSATTIICQSLDGKRYDLGKGPRPPIHINCRSTTVAELDESLGLDFLNEGATRSSVNGPVSAKETYYSWLKDQPSDFQKKALGATRAKLFRDGGLSSDNFAKLNLGRNFQPLTLDEMRVASPSIFTKAGIPPTG